MSFVFRLGVSSWTCASRTTMVKSRCVVEDGKVDVALMRDSIGGYEVLPARVLG